MNTLANYSPRSPQDFIGPARRLAERLDWLANQARAGGTGPLKLLIYGPPGVGKTALSEMLARRLVDHPIYIESLNGREVTLERVREWMGHVHYKCVGWTVKIVNELDTATPAAQDLLLSYLDAMQEGHAFLGTSNLDVMNFTERLQTRLKQYRLLGPESEQIEAFLVTRFRLPAKTAQRVAFGAGSNVRAALLDAEDMVEGSPLPIRKTPSADSERV